MGIKKIITGAILSLLMFTAHAQDVRTDSDEDEIETRNEQTDSLKAITDELSQLKSRLDNVENERHYENVWKRKKYWKLGFGNPSIERTDGETMNWETKFAVSLQCGRTAYFHSKPLWGIVKIGLDYGFMDLSYAKLKLKTSESTGSTPSTPETYPGSNHNGGFDDIESDDPNGSIGSLLGVDLGMHKFEYGLHVGPSISVNPWNHIIVAAYFHAMPTASGILENDKFSYGFGCAMSTGVSVAYKAISVGVEGVWSTIKYKQASFDEEEDNEGDNPVNLFNTKDFKLKQKGLRFYVALRF